MTPQEILSMFVAKDDIRYYLNKPFMRGEYTYATNGHIAVRVLGNFGFDLLQEDKIKSLEGMFVSGAFDDLKPLFELPEADFCIWCGGDGKAWKCKTCDGDGEFEYEDHTYECKECHGDGQVNGDNGQEKIDCFHCDGAGYSQQKVMVGESAFDRRLLAKIAVLPGALFREHPTENMEPVYFTFDGGEGLLMPMRY